ncbi:UDP-N-acetylglucosamine 2-epimerase [Roseivirga pacifica]|uniref:UDP-N-acetylglucosamine 2-epimerase n=1 Tax=Roseivirga pacifica TaxID=1267423 RepID=UPI003BAB287F
MDKRKICVVTGTRAEFGLLYWLMSEIRADDGLELQVVATGMHLSPEFGLTYRDIEESGFQIDKKVEMLLSSDSSVGLSKSMGLGMISFGEVYQDLQPDIIVLLGDRFEAFAACAAAMVSRIPVAHIHGGEATEGLIDEPIRHSITKMAHLHFTATEEYAKRVMQLGESPDRVFNVGTPGLDNIEKLQLLTREQLEESLDFVLGTSSAIVTFHPVTLENQTAEGQVEALLKALSVFEDLSVIFTMPNADTEGRIIMDLINEFVRKYPDRTKAFTSLGQLRYLSALKHVDIVVGNSSSGLIEVPSFKKATVNIGDRQRGRIKSASVIDCEPDENAIVESIQKGLSNEFRKGLEKMENPYGRAGASKRIKEILAASDLTGILKKRFHDQ